MRNEKVPIPERIWLQWHGDANPEDYGSDGPVRTIDVFWCVDKIYDEDVEYMRADILRAALAAAEGEARTSETFECAVCEEELGLDDVSAWCDECVRKMIAAEAEELAKGARVEGLRATLGAVQLEYHRVNTSPEGQRGVTAYIASGLAKARHEIAILIADAEGESAG